MKTSVLSCQFLKSLVIGACIGSALACGSEGFPTAPETTAIEARAAQSGPGSAKVKRQVVFRFGMRGTSSEDFVAVTTDEAVIQKARQQLQLPRQPQPLHKRYIAAAGRRPTQLGGSCRLRGEIVEVSFGACDARPGAVEPIWRVVAESGSSALQQLRKVRSSRAR